ncbi:MAG: ribonuclease HI family protein [Candidatus Komeilibacteria bacterium]
MTDKNITKLFTDGGARGNPGPAAAGVHIIWPTGEVYDFGKYLGEQTNNQAEYQALYLGLKYLRDQGVPKVIVYMDSELIIRQLKREYKVKNQDLAKWFVKVWNIAQEFSSISWQHVPRADNKAADKQVNIALDKAQANS